jgi:hypothetical protein
VLGPIRRFAAARLANVGEPLGGLEGHLLGVLEAAGAGRGAQNQDVRRLDSEQLNLQAVLGWMAREGRPSGPMLRAIGDVWRIIKRTEALLPGGEFTAQAAAGRLLTVEDALSQALLPISAREARSGAK